MCSLVVLTGIETTRNTDSTGLYLITNLLPGTYSIAVEAKGFKRFVQENIVLRVDSKINIDAQLELGEVTQEVTVNAAPPMLQTEKADVNVVLPEQMIESLPTVGTNALHGSLFWFNRNNKFFAANPFSEKVAGTGPQGKGTGTAPFRWNQGGGSVGGPIKKNKMFFFGDYQFNRTREGSSQLATVPLLDFQRGDFSSIAATHPIFDPLTGSPDGTGRTQFSCNGKLNVICPDRFNPVSVKLLDLLNGELANRFVDQTKTENNFAAPGSSLYDQDQVDGRYDVNLSSRDKAYQRYTYFTALLG